MRCPNLNSELRPELLVETIKALEKRMQDRMPGRNLNTVATELREIAIDASDRARWIRRPNKALRLLVGLLILSMIGIVIYIVTHLHFKEAGAWEILEGMEAAISSVVYLGLAMVFVVSLETRLRRRKVLAALHELRVLAHIIDMHQLAKDPESFIYRLVDPQEDIPHNFTPHMLNRYLDCCTDLLSLIGKVAALYIQNSQDAVVLASVNEIETLTTGLSQKIWQKIMVLDQIAGGQLKPQEKGTVI